MTYRLMYLEQNLFYQMVYLNLHSHLFLIIISELRGT